MEHISIRETGGLLRQIEQISQIGLYLLQPFTNFDYSAGTA